MNMRVVICKGIAFLQNDNYYIDQITTEAEGKSWSISSSSAKDYAAFKPRSTLPKSASYTKQHSNGYSNFGSDDSYQDNFQDAEFYKRFAPFFFVIYVKEVKIHIDSSKV